MSDPKPMTDEERDSIQRDGITTFDAVEALARYDATVNADRKRIAELTRLMKVFYEGEGTLADSVIAERILTGSSIWDGADDPTLCRACGGKIND